jgi:hypothetical protein
MARLMVLPPRDLLREFAVPAEVADEAVGSPRTRQMLRDSVGRTRRLCRDLGLITPASRRLWVKVGLWDDDRDGEDRG